MEEGELSKARRCEKSVSVGDLFIYATAAVQPVASVYEVNAPKTALEKRRLKTWEAGEGRRVGNLQAGRGLEGGKSKV